MAGSTSLGYYLVYCPGVMLASCYKSIKGMGHHHHDANGKRLQKARKVIKVETLED
jgi:hypothetical protein